MLCVRREKVTVPNEQKLQTLDKGQTKQKVEGQYGVCLCY
jgi:hypothetical protein